MIISVWDDEWNFGSRQTQTTKENISEILKGYQRDSENNGYEILRVKGWDYSDLITTYEKSSNHSKRRTRSCFSSRKRINTNQDILLQDHMNVTKTEIV
jgi:hypothetical protein